MATLQELSRRIKSVGNTRKITKAMEMVAAAKLRRAQTGIETLRPFADALVELTVQVAQGAGSTTRDPLLVDRDEVRSVLVLLVTSDRGLAGPINSNALRRALRVSDEWTTRGAQVHWAAIGTKGASSLRFRELQLDEQWTGFTDQPGFEHAERIAGWLVERFRDGAYDKVVIVYNRFHSAVQQDVVVADVLPIAEPALRQATAHMLLPGQTGRDDDPRMFVPDGGPAGGVDRDGHGRAAAADRPAPTADWLVEPDAETLLAKLLPTYVSQSVLRSLLESAASKHGSQMNAMRNASENAGDLVAELTLVRNRARQAAITQEILEIVGGAAAV